MKIRKYPYTYEKVINENGTANPVYQNLLIPGIPDVMIYENSSIITRKISKEIKRFNYFDYLDTYYNDTFLDHETSPYLICFCDGSFTNLEKINYDPVIIDYLNNQGLNIYLWELMVYKTPNTKTNKWLLEINQDSNIEQIFKDNKDIIVGFETNNDVQTLRCFEFDKIEEFVNRNNLKNVTVYTGNYKNKEYFCKQYSLFDIKVKDVAVASMFNVSDKKLTAYTYMPNIKPPSENKIDYKFCSFNKRYSGQRNLIAAYLLKRNSLISYNADVIDFVKGYNYVNLDDNRFNFWNDINNKLWFDFNSWEVKHPRLYNKLMHNLEYLDNVRYLSIDKDIKDMWLMYEEDPLPVEYYHSAFCAVVTETVFAQPCGHYADKTLNAIKCFRPFVLVAPPYTLEYLKQCGVKTFSDYWDESYDRETNHERRLIKIFKVIDYIDSLTLDELKDMYVDMQPILEHNYQTILSLKYQN